MILCWLYFLRIVHNVLFINSVMKTWHHKSKAQKDGTTTNQFCIKQRKYILSIDKNWCLSTRMYEETIDRQIFMIEFIMAHGISSDFCWLSTLLAYHASQSYSCERTSEILFWLFCFHILFSYVLALILFWSFLISKYFYYNMTISSLLKHFQNPNYMCNL